MSCAVKRLFAEDGTSLPGHGSVQEADQPYLRGDQRRARTEQNAAEPKGGGRNGQSNDDRLGQLLLSGTSQQSLLRGRTTRAPAAASVAECQAQDFIGRKQSVSDGALAR